MRKIKRIEEEYKKTKIEIECTEEAKQHMMEFLNYFKGLGNIGHTVDFEVDDKVFTFDGDGRDKIFNIKVKEIE